MRNTIMALLLGPILFGCLTPEDSPTDNGFAVGNSGNSAPTITGNPLPDVVSGDLYEFEPNAADADEDKLTFAVQNKPTWATFTSSTGLLRGRPELGDIGVYNNILISVSDGTDSSSLPSFSLTVSQTADGIVTLSWTAPTQNSDGSTLVDLAGYKIYYGRSSGNYDKEIRINNPSITTYVVQQLSSGNYYFSATALNSTGVESLFSSEVIRSSN